MTRVTFAEIIHIETHPQRILFFFFFVFFRLPFKGSGYSARFAERRESQILETAKQPHCDGDADASQGFSECFLLHNQELQADDNSL